MCAVRLKVLNFSLVLISVCLAKIAQKTQKPLADSVAIVSLNERQTLVVKDRCQGLRRGAHTITIFRFVINSVPLTDFLFSKLQLFPSLTHPLISSAYPCLLQPRPLFWLPLLPPSLFYKRYDRDAHLTLTAHFNSPTWQARKTLGQENLLHWHGPKPSSVLRGMPYQSSSELSRFTLLRPIGQANTATAVLSPRKGTRARRTQICPWSLTSLQPPTFTS